MAIATLGTQDGMQLDAILLDHWAPEADAAALIAELRARRPALPILMLTANGSVAHAVGGDARGRDRFPGQAARARTPARRARRRGRRQRPRASCAR